MDKRMYHKPRFYNKLQNRRYLGMEQLAVLPTGTRIDVNHPDKNEYVADWLKDPNDNTHLYIFKKHVNTKKTVYSAIASSGELSLNIGDTYLLKHDQTMAKICTATLENVITVKDRIRGNGVYLYSNMSFMVFK